MVRRVWNETKNRCGKNHLEGEAAISQARFGLVSGDESHAQNINDSDQKRNEKVFIFSK